MVSLPSEFRASLESYHGPLDLLLYLIKQEEIDIFNIPIAELVHQYQLYLSLLQEVDPNACGEFLVMAARLMEIKSKLLLPRQTIEEDDEEYEDPRMELVRQLLEYKKFKERAILLERRLELHRRRYERPRIDLPEEEDDDMGPLDIGNVSVWDLLTAYHRIQIAIGQRAPHQVVVEDRPQEAFIRDVIEELESSPSSVVVFDRLFRGARTRQEVCGYFLAVLQLAKEYRIVLEQEEQGGDIYVRLRSEEEIQELMEAHLAESRREEEDLRGALGAGGEAEDVAPRGEDGEPAAPPEAVGETRASEDAPEAPGRDAASSSEDAPDRGEPLVDSRDADASGTVDPESPADPRGGGDAGQRR